MSKERCPTCGRTFSNRLGLGVHQARNPGCRDREAIRARAREREQRYRQRHIERRRAQVREARRRLLEKRPDYFRDWRAAHPDSEHRRRIRWRLANPALLAEQRRRRRERRRTLDVPLPPSHSQHPLFDQAWAVLHAIGVRRDDHLVAIHDPRWEDACSEVVVALLEGRDAVAAARQTLAAERRHAAVTVTVDDLDRLGATG